MTSPEKMLRRLKQWLNMATTCGTFSDFDAIKRVDSLDAFFAILESERLRIPA